MTKDQMPPPGTALREEDIEKQKILTVAYKPKANYSWTTGAAIDKFLRGLAEGRIIGGKCNHCHRVLVPPRTFCEWCFKPINNWVELPDTGTVNTYSISYISTDTTRLKEPIIPAVVEIDGSTHAGFLHLLGDVTPDTIKIGMRVQAVWKDPHDRTGSITDIKFFKPLKS